MYQHIDYSICHLAVSDTFHIKRYGKKGSAAAPATGPVLQILVQTKRHSLDQFSFSLSLHRNHQPLLLIHLKFYLLELSQNSSMAALISGGDLPAASILARDLNTVHDTLAPVQLGQHVFEATTSIGIQLKLDFFICSWSNCKMSILCIHSLTIFIFLYRITANSRR